MPHPPPAIPGFAEHRIPVAHDITLNTAIGGTGTPVILLHGFPQTHLMWRHVAPELATEHTVICPDLRGYGASDKPTDPDGTTYSKRTMAADVIALAKALGHDRFALVGHDRGALVAIRAGLDHPDKVTHLASLDVLPTLDMWEVMRGTSAAVGFHLYLMAQPHGLPEQLIGASPDAFFGHFLDVWTRDPAAVPPEIHAAYLAASRAAVPSIVADYRASAGIDVTHDRADRGRRSAHHLPHVESRRLSPPRQPPGSPAEPPASFRRVRPGVAACRAGPPAGWSWRRRRRGRRW